jgi:hypothetical protein
LHPFQKRKKKKQKLENNTTCIESSSFLLFTFHSHYLLYEKKKPRRGRDRMVVGFTGKSLWTGHSIPPFSIFFLFISMA